MFKTKVYLYDSSQESNGYRGQDLSKYLLQGDQAGEDITQEMDTAEMTLSGLDTQKEFTPGTKFIIDLVEVVGEQENIIETAHRMVAKDTPNQPIISDDTYFDHHISLTEPSVVAQQRLVDNISVTYKLKDVSLQEISAIPDNEQLLNTESSFFSPERNFGVERYLWLTAYYTRTYYGKYFQFEGQVEILNTENTSFSLEYENIENFKVGDKYFAKFKVPKLAIYAGVRDTKNFAKIGYASIDYVIEEFSLTDEYNPIRRVSGSFISNSNLENNSVYSPDISVVGRQEWIAEGRETHFEAGTRVYRTGVRKYTETSASDPTYITDNIEIFPDKRYKITISLHEFEDNVPYGYNVSKWIEPPTLSHYTDTKDLSNPLGTMVYSTTNQTSGFTGFTTYNIDTLKSIIYSSSTPYSALALLQKAIINSSIYEKENGVYIADINKSNLPFYIDENFVDELSSTIIIENFYNQKNLWEIMLDVGHYIHSIPELKFGKDDKFLITFNQLGRTDEQQKSSNKVSVFNSRSIEDYISATSSYITNMVQLGGYVEEWVVPKTTNEQMLVSNDTAEIIFSKPIIELLQILVRKNDTGEIADMTPFVYEENVYKTLRLDYQLNPNRGIAMYYSLGENVITGGQFQLPQANTNIYSDYAIKKVIYCAFNNYPVIAPQPITGYWSDLKVQDYSFFVRYRTKDSVRQNHIRPDIRKYLLNSKHDRFPEHNQFNNQTDVVVDSLKFGNNMFGKLIKTGNSTYEIYEWNDLFENIKHKGELYRINGELYYVAKVMHYRYSSYILSKVTYSKDYNELSAVVGIPSEPRFYEISEQSLIWREFAINDILLLTDNKEQLEYKSNYVFNFDHLSGLMLGEGTDFAKYAITVYKGDKDIGGYDQTVGQPNFYKEVLNPINAYSSENTLTYEWDMIDNYSAGDKVIDVDINEEILNADERAYSSLRAVGYTDIYGRSALLDFYILGGIRDLTTEEIKSLPESPIKTKQDDPNDTRTFIGDLDILGTNVKEYDTNFNGRGIGLLKDCREAMSINFNLQLATSSDTFVFSPYVYLPKKENIRAVLLAEEVNKLSSGYINNSAIITPIDKDGNTMNPYFDFEITKDYAQSSWDSNKTVTTNFGIDFESLFEDVADGHFQDEGVSNLPIEYQETEYLQNSGTQRIDTGLTPTNSTSIDITYQSLVVVGQSQYILGARRNESTTVEYAFNGSSSTNYWDIRFNGVVTSITNMNRTTDKYRSVVELNEGEGSWTLTNLTTSTTSQTSLSGVVVNATTNLRLFAYNDLNVNTHKSLRIFACKIYEAGVLVRDFVPCYRKADGVAGLYDKVTEAFFTSNSGVDFPNIAPEINVANTLPRAKSIAVLCDVSLNTGIDTGVPIIPYKTQFIFARNIPSSWDKARATKPVYFGAPNKIALFTNKQ